MEPGTKLGPYEITEQLGAGGMGEVYLAQDTRLGRKVAIKVLPAEFASDPERLARFEQEARAAAALNHPHIAVVHDIGTEGDTHFMVQEYLEGDTLREPLQKGALPLKKALGLATEIAEALAAAHAAGIIHRDLKPENIFVTKEGHAKVLDFGLAKLTEVAGAGSPGGATQSPTMMGTVAGQVMGTAGYMAPEQVEGSDKIDHRADLFAFGCVLYEMVSGVRAFAGRSIAETLAHIQHDDPTPIQESDPSLPDELQRIIRKSVAKEPGGRYQGAGDLAVDLKAIALEVESGTARSAHDATAEVTDPAWVVSGARVLPWAVAGVFAALAGVFFAQSLPPPPLPTEHYEVEMPGILSVGASSALSSDGRFIAYTGVNGEGNQVIYARALDHPNVYEVEGTTGGEYQFFSPNSEWLGFHAQGVLWKVPIQGGRREAICETPEAVGATWGPKGEIIYAVPPGDEGTVHVWPHFLPGGESILFTISGGSDDRSQVAHLSLADGITTILLDGSAAAYTSTGHLLFRRGGALSAVAFDIASGDVLGDAVEVVAEVQWVFYGGAHYGVADSGHLVYLEAATQLVESSLVTLDRDGNPTPAYAAQDAGWVQPQFSPSGSRVAYARIPRGGGSGIYSLDLDAGGRRIPLYRPGTGLATWPVWSPDGEWVAFVSFSPTGINTFRVRADGSGGVEQLTFESNVRTIPSSWSADGTLAIEQGPNNQRDVLLLPMGDGQEHDLQEFLVGEYNERGAKFSPDGRWLAYTSDRSGLDQIWVVPYPQGGAPVLVSIGGGKEPAWSRAGAELFYRNNDEMWVVPYEAGATFNPGDPELLFRGDYSYGYIDWAFNYDVYPDGQRFLMVKDGPVPKLQVLVNWFEELKRLVPTGGS